MRQFREAAWAVGAVVFLWLCMAEGDRVIAGNLESMGNYQRGKIRLFVPDGSGNWVLDGARAAR